MRRNLPLVVAGALCCVTVLAACSGDDTSSDDTTPIISLVEDTTPELVDKCAADYVPSSTEPAVTTTPAASGAPTTPESSLFAPATSEVTATSTGATASTEASTASTEPTATQSTESTVSTASTESTESSASTPSTESATATSAPGATTEGSESITSSGETTPASSVTGGSEPESAQPTGSEANGSEPTESSVTETTEDAFASVPEVETPSRCPTSWCAPCCTRARATTPRPRTATSSACTTSACCPPTAPSSTPTTAPGSRCTFTLGAGGVIDGWDQGLVGAREGDQIQLDVPADLAYGDQPPANSNIPPGAALTFVIDVVDVTEVPTVTPPSEPPGELETTVIEHGPSDGHKADEGDVVSIRYVGVLQDGGTQFDSNYAAATPTNVTVGAASNIAGWNEGLLGVRTGDQIQLDIPADLAYGTAGSQQPPVPADAPVSYIIEVEDVLDVPDITLPDGRVDEVTKTVITEGPGDGRVAQQFDTVTAYFTAELSADGTQIGSNFGTGSPAPLVLGQESFLPGIDEQLEGLQAGDVVQIDVPAKDALGDTGSSDGAIPPDADLSFLFQIEDVTGPPLFDVPDEAPTELVTTVNTEGSGPAAAEGDTVLIHYIGVLQDDGTRFASNWDGELYPVTLGAGDVIPGWEQGLVGVRAGEELQLDVPAELAYGSAGQGDRAARRRAVLPRQRGGRRAGRLGGQRAVAERPPGHQRADDGAQHGTDTVVGDGAELTEGSLAYIDVQISCAQHRRDAAEHVRRRRARSRQHRIGRPDGRSAPGPDPA